MALTKIDDRGLKTPIDLLDNEKIRFGTGNDFEISHNGTDNLLVSGTGLIRIRHSNEDAIITNANGAVEIYYDNSKKFETSSGGGTLTGNWICTNDFKLDNSSNAGKDVVWNASNNRLRFEDSVEAAFGDGEDLKISHDGSNSLISNTTGELRISDESKLVLQTDSLRIRNFANDEAYIAATANGNVELYHDGAKRIETESGGIKITGDLKLANDSNKIKLGAGDDLEIFHDGTHSKLINSTGDLHLASNNAVKILGGSDTSEVQAVFNDNGAVELYHDNFKKFETTGAGVTVGGTGKATLHVKAHDNAWEAGLLLEDNTGDDGWNIHPDSGDTSLMIGYNDDVTTALTSQTATPIARFRSAGGICFGSDNAAANAIDDYEEGTFTPAWNTGSASSAMFDSVVYNNTAGHYTKIGNLVTFFIRIQCSSLTNGNSNSHVILTALPFSSHSGTGSNGGAVFNYAKAVSQDASEDVVPTMHIGQDGTALSFWETGGNTYKTGNTHNDFTETLHIHGQYPVN